MTLADKEQSKRKLHSTLTSSSPSSPKVVKLIKGRHAPIQHIRGSGGVCWVFFLQTHSDEALQTSRKPKPSGGTEIFGNRHLCFQLSTNQPRKKLPSDHGVFLTFFFLRVMHTFSAITFYLTSVSHFTARPAEAHHLGRGGGGGGKQPFCQMATLDAADLHQLCKVHFLPMPKDQISCLQNNARADDVEKAAKALRIGNHRAGLGLLPGSARMSRGFDGKLRRRGITAK